MKTSRSSRNSWTLRERYVWSCWCSAEGDELRRFVAIWARCSPQGAQRVEKTELMVQYRLKIISERWNPRGVKCEGCWLTKVRTTPPARYVV